MLSLHAWPGRVVLLFFVCTLSGPVAHSYRHVECLLFMRDEEWNGAYYFLAELYLYLMTHVTNAFG